MNELENLVQRVKDIFIPRGQYSSQLFIQLVDCGQMILDNFKRNIERFEISKTMNQFLFHLTVNEMVKNLHRKFTVIFRADLTMI